MNQLSESELEVIRGTFRRSNGTDHEMMKMSMVRLAHDGSDRAMEILRELRATLPPQLRGFYECAWDECSYFNFISKVDEVSIQPGAAESLLATEADEQEMDSQCRQMEDELADRGVLVDLVPGVPVAIRLAYVKRLLETIGTMRYHGSGFVHFDGCTGSCDWCIQRTWCDVAQSAGVKDTQSKTVI